MAEDVNKYGVPALISLFFPGIGQIIKGHVIKGIIIIVMMIGSILLIFGGIGLITTPILWLWNVYDAYNSHNPD